MTQTTSGATLVTLDPNSSGISVNASDIEIGAVELKDSTTDVRVNVQAANVAATTASTVVLTQPIDNAGNKGTPLVPGSTAGQAPTNAATAAYAASLVVKATPGTLFGLTGYNSKGSTQFIQLHDATALPADTAVPKVVITVPATSNFSIDFGAYGKRFATGIVVANSSTGPTLTTGSADVWAEARYV